MACRVSRIRLHVSPPGVQRACHLFVSKRLIQDEIHHRLERPAHRSKRTDHGKYHRSSLSGCHLCHPRYLAGAWQIKIQYQRRIVAMHQQLDRLARRVASLLLDLQDVQKRPQHPQRRAILRHQQGIQFHKPELMTRRCLSKVTAVINRSLPSEASSRFGTALIVQTASKIRSLDMPRFWGKRTIWTPDSVESRPNPMPQTPKKLVTRPFQPTNR